jgi:hypothetical protein
MQKRLKKIDDETQDASKPTLRLQDTHNQIGSETKKEKNLYKKNDDVDDEQRKTQFSTRMFENNENQMSEMEAQQHSLLRPKTKPARERFNNGLQREREYQTKNASLRNNNNGTNFQIDNDTSFIGNSFSSTEYQQRNEEDDEEEEEEDTDDINVIDFSSSRDYDVESGDTIDRHNKTFLQNNKKNNQNELEIENVNMTIRQHAFVISRLNRQLKYNTRILSIFILSIFILVIYTLYLNVQIYHIKLVFSEKNRENVS